MTKIIGSRYVIVKKIGSGGMADVFLAMDSVLNREVAIKVLRGSLSSDPVALLRFQREARSISALSNSNVVEVYDVGEDEGQHYIVMEMVRGTTLKELIHRRGALDTVEAVAIMKQIALAVGAAHKAQVIHRDIKPQNILVKDDGTVKITDFGIALAEDAIQLTKQDSVMGSVHYMAPELSRGEGASYQSDIYSLGTVFYELLTGDVPYRGENPVDIAMKHLRDPFPNVKRFNSKIPNSIVNIISKSTQKNKNLRYSHCDQLIADLAVCLDPKVMDEPIWSPVFDDNDIQTTRMFDRIDNELTVKPKKKQLTKFVVAGITLLALVIVAWFVLKPEEVTDIHIPNVIGESLDVGSATLSDLGLYVSTAISYEYSDTHDTGKIIAIKPGVDAVVEKGAQVRLTVSSGLNYTVEDYAGKTLEEVRALLNDKNITIKTVNEFKQGVAPGIILRQEGLVAGDKVNHEIRSELILYVSSQVELVIPAEIIGQSVASAQASLIEKGLKVETEVLTQVGMSPSEIESLKFNVVIRSNPMPGSYYIQTDSNVITLYYYEEAPVETPPETQTPDSNQEAGNDTGENE